MEKERRVAIIGNTTYVYGRGTLRGIQSAPHHPLNLTTAVWGNEPRFFSHIRSWKPDGIIAQLNNSADARMIVDLGVPVVNVGDAFAEMQGICPRVGVDDRAIGAMAAKYFLQQGFRNFAFSPYRWYEFSAERYKGFADTLQDAGYPRPSVDDQLRRSDCMELPAIHEANGAEDKWLQSLPKPLAIFAATDGVSARVVRSCLRAGLRVPADAAVVGVDNDELFCLGSKPVLSSIETPLVPIGYQAMMLMKRLLTGEKVSMTEALLLPPVRVVERHSSDQLAVQDPALAAAIRYIREHIAGPISVDQIAEGMMMSRRQLELKFQSVLHRSPAKQVRRERFERACQMLADTALPIAEIAQRVGLNYTDPLFVMFRQECQMTPADYRSKFRRGGTPHNMASTKD